MSTVDCSRYQGVLTVPMLQAWAAAGVSRVILKCGGGDDGRYQDSKWVVNSANVIASGIRLEAYWFNGTTDPVGDAQFVNSFVPAGVRVWADVESEGSMAHWSDDQADAFETTVVAAGHPSGTYMSSSVTFGSWPKCSRRPLWVANYSSSTVPRVGNWTAPVLWQYTSTGHLPGYSGNLDLSQDLAGLDSLTATTLGGFLMALTDDQQRQIYEALVVGGVSATAYYKTDALINILRGEVEPVIQAASDALNKPSAYSGGFRPIDVIVSQTPAILAAVTGHPSAGVAITPDELATLSANLKAGLGDALAADLAARLAS